MDLRIENKRAVWTTATAIYPLPTAFLALSVALVSYLAAKLGGVLAVPPQEVSALWPGNALLVSVLLLVPRGTWPALIPAGLAGFVLYDLQVGLPPSTSALFVLANAVEIVIVTVGLGYCFDGVPRLNTLKALAKYSLFAILIGPFIGSFVGAFAIPGFYFTDWRIFFFSEAIAFLTLTPVVLSWANPRSLHALRSIESRLEAAALMIALASLGYVIFFDHSRTIPPVLLFSLVPFLLWAALRFGSQGISMSIIVIAFCSIWGAIHGGGPFTASNPLHAILWLQLFLLFAAVPFMFLAVVVEEREQARVVEKELSKRLISEQERERSRLARELHDDICQRLAMLSMKIEKVTTGLGHRQESVADQLDQIWQECSNLTGEVQSLSHELHPSILDNLGLATAVKSFCREVSEQNGVMVEFVDRNIPNSLPPEISLSLFRVVQEAIHNALKYSGQKRFEVRLETGGGGIQLEISDRGVGFDPANMKNSAGLGLVSMAERIHQVNGTFKIVSQPNSGTRIQVRVPLATQSKARTAAVN